jgi:hypothetical protein
MSANGVFSTTLDYQYFGGAVVQNSGEFSGSLDYSFDSSVQIPIVGQIDNFNLDFSFTAGIETPELNGTADLSFGFSVSAQADQGIQRFATVEWKKLQVPFSVSANGYSTIAGTLDQTLEFSLDTNIFVYSELESSGTIGFSVSSKGTNVSTHVYDVQGANYCTIEGMEYNDVQILSSYNSIHLTDNGIRQAEIITAFNK